MYAKIVLITAAVLLSGQVYAQSTTTPKASSSAKKKAAAKATTTAPTAPAVVEVKKEEVKAVEPVVAATTQTTGQEVLKYMKEKFSASYHGEYYFVRREAPSADKANEDIQDIKIMHNPTIIYKPTKNWQALATAEFKYSDVDGLNTSFPNTFFRALFTVTRKNILTEKDNGFQLDAGIGRRQFNTGISQLSSYGNNRVFTTLSKGFGKHNGSLFVQYLQNDYKHPSATTWKHGVEIIPTINLQLTEKLTWLINDDIVINLPHHDNTDRDFSITHEMNLGYINYQWNDKLGTYFQVKYYHSEDFTEAFQSEDDWTEYYIGASYSFTPKATVTAELGSEISHARDGRDGFAEKIKYPELALYVDLSF